MLLFLLLFEGLVLNAAAVVSVVQGAYDSCVRAKFLTYVSILDKVANAPPSRVWAVLYPMQKKLI